VNIEVPNYIGVIDLTLLNSSYPFSRQGWQLPHQNAKLRLSCSSLQLHGMSREHGTEFIQPHRIRQ